MSDNESGDATKQGVDEKSVNIQWEGLLHQANHLGI